MQNTRQARDELRKSSELDHRQPENQPLESTVPPKGDGHESYNLVLHEVGHAVGDAVAGGGVDDPKFIEAREKDKALLDAYETQGDKAGIEETYAESLARFYGDDPKDARKYPNLHAYWASDPLVAEAE